MIHPWKYLREEVQLNHLHANCTSDMIIAPLKAAEFFSSGIINLCYYKASMKFMKTSWHINTCPEGLWKGNTLKYAWFQASISLSRARLKKNIYENVPNGDSWGNGTCFVVVVVVSVVGFFFFSSQFLYVLLVAVTGMVTKKKKKKYEEKHKTCNRSFLTLINIFTTLMFCNVLLQGEFQLVHPFIYLEVNLKSLY